MAPARRKEHPLAGRRVVCNSELATGALVYVLDWVERLPAIGSGDPGAVLVRAPGGTVFAIGADDLPNYDPVPVGYVS